MGSTEITTGACTGRDRLSQVSNRSRRQALSRSDRDRGHCRDRAWLRLEELREELERSFLSTNSPPLGLSSWSRNLLARARAGHEGLRE
ncbi:hypothetical protein Taro_054077, partial [Colocasia esculenta]|nr:hypothetical protein [Colocasia esculenta]